MATSNNDRVSSSGLLLFAKGLWTIIKGTFLSKNSPAGKIFEFPYGSTDYSLDDLNQLASEGKTIRCVIDKGVRLTLYYIGPGPGDIDVAYFIGPFIPSTSGGYASFATMNSNKNWTGGTTQSKYSWSDLIGTQPAPIAHTHDDRYYTESEMDTKLGNKSNTDHHHNGSDIDSEVYKAKALNVYKVPTTSGYPNLDNAMSSGYSQFHIEDSSSRNETQCTLNISTMQENISYELNFSMQKKAVLKIVNDLTIDRYVRTDYENKTLHSGESVSYSFPVGARINMVRDGAVYYFNCGSVKLLAAGSAFQPVFINSDGSVTGCNFKIV